VVVLPAPAPVVSYYPSPYPWYYYPWGAGAMWAGGVFFGASTAWAMGWAHNEIWHDVDFDDIGDIDFDRNFDRDVDRGDLNVDNSVKNKFEGGRGGWPEAGRRRGRAGAAVAASGRSPGRW
jgi:hypothetical protein